MKEKNKVSAGTGENGRERRILHRHGVKSEAAEVQTGQKNRFSSDVFTLAENIKK